MMLYLILNIAIGMGIWISLVESHALVDLAIGMVVVLSGWGVLQRLLDIESRISLRSVLFRLYRFLRYFAVIVLPSSLRSSWNVIRYAFMPARKCKPAIIAVDLEGLDAETLFLLAFAVTLSPGDQVVDIDPAAGRIFIHALHAPDPRAFRAGIQRQYQHVKDILR